jgi:hypothetical protein
MTVLLRDTIPPALVPEQFYQVRKKLSDEAANLPAGCSGRSSTTSTATSTSRFTP